MLCGFSSAKKKLIANFRVAAQQLNRFQLLASLTAPHIKKEPFNWQLSEWLTLTMFSVSIFTPCRADFFLSLSRFMLLNSHTIQ
jgi:hypothetical protein